MADESKQPASSLISTKVHAPISRRLITRHRIVSALQANCHAKLTLICAPAGYGKSSLLAGWAAGDPRRFAWLWVDEHDNDPVRFWTYIIAALRTVEPSVGKRSIPMLTGPGTNPIQRVVAELVNEVAAIPQPLVLAIDDYHVIRDPGIHRSLSSFVEFLPQQLHLAIATRAEPCLPIAKLRARGELIEINGWALAFSEQEAEGFLNGLLNLGLSPSDVRILRERTEGWAAGLYLAALWLHDRHDAQQFVYQFAGDHRHVVDYLWTEVLAGQDSELQSFLMRSSILDRLSAPLCDAVTGLGGSAERLRDIERSNLFVIPLDSKREWYRYHHLFRDLLRREVTAREPGRLPDLHRRAARWLMDAGFVSDAIHHTILAGDLEAACELIAAHWVEFLIVGRHHTILAWLQALPEDALMLDARVCVAGAFVSLSIVRLDQTEVWLEKAENALTPGPFHDGFGSVAAAAVYARAAHRLGIGSLTEARAFARQAVVLLDETSPHRQMALSVIGVCSFLLGQAGESLQAFRDALTQGQTVEMAQIHTLGWQAIVHVELEQWEEAEKTISKTHSVAAGVWEEHFLYGLSMLAQAKVHEHHGCWEQAETAFPRSIELLRGGLPAYLAYALPAYACFQHSRGRIDESRQLASEARQLVEGFSDPGILQYAVKGMERRPRRTAPGQSEQLIDSLSSRERSVLKLLDSTLTQRQIAAELYVSINTVKTHTGSVFRKLGVSSRKQAVSRARELGLI